MSITSKKPKTAEEFISEAKMEQPPKSYLRDKTFLLRIPAELHKLAREKAADERSSLHEFILRAMETAVKK